MFSFSGSSASDYVDLYFKNCSLFSNTRLITNGGTTDTALRNVIVENCRIGNIGNRNLSNQWQFINRSRDSVVN